MKIAPPLAVIALGCALPSVALAGTRTITLDEAERLALNVDPHLRADAQRTIGADEMVRSTRGTLLPSVHVSEEFQHYDSPFSVTFALPGLPSTPFLARTQDANTFTVAVAQPLVGLLRRSQDLLARNRAAEASEAQLEADRAGVREGVRIDFLRLFQAKALEDVARASESELAEQVKVASAKLKAGVFTNADVLRTRVALGNAKQQEIVAHAQGEVARAELLGALALPLDDATTVFVEPTELLAKSRSPVPPQATAQKRALERRPELKQLKLQADTAEHESRAQFYGLLPEVDLEAAYLRVDGQVFAPINSAFIGARANWAIWESGVSWYAQRAAAAREQAARFDIESQKRQIGVDVSTDLAQAQAVTNAVMLAEETIESAREAYRVMQELVNAGSATTTDLLDAEAALTQARLNLARAQYDRAIAYVTLLHALGE